MFVFKKILVIQFLILILSSTSFAQWFPVNSGTTNNLNGLYFLNTGIGYTVGDAGTILKTTDAGLSWNPLTSGTSGTLYDAYFFDDNIGVVVGEGGLIRRTTNGGTDWTTIASGVTDNLISVSFNGVNGISGGTSQTIIYSTDSGVSWQIGQTGFFGGGFWGASMQNTTTAFVAGQNSIFQPFVGKTTNGGVTWDFFNFYFQNNEGRCDDIFFFNDTTGVTSGVLWDGQGAIARTTNSGTDWTTTIFPFGIQGMDFPTIDIGFAVGWSGIILSTTNSGLTWTENTSGTSTNLTDVDFTGNALNGIAVGEGGIILRTDNGGVPVELTSFTCNLNGNVITLNWTTATETNNQGFQVERKINDEWLSIGFIDGHGTTTEMQSYTYKDNLNDISQTGKIFYRLKQIDFNGTYEYSDVVEIEFNPINEYLLKQNYPNPFNPGTVIEFSLPEDASNVRLSIFNVLGEKVTELVNSALQSGKYRFQWNAQNESAGIYFYELRADNFVSIKKMNLLK